MEHLRKEIRACTKCALVMKPCVPPVIVDGAQVMFVARNPGRTEFRLQNGPFEPNSTCGRLFDQQLTRVGLSRFNSWVTNLVLGYTEGDRPPTDDEIENCFPYLERQIEAVKPRLIVAVGMQSAQKLIGPHYRWKQDHGSVVSVRFQFGETTVTSTVVPVTHPGQAIRGVRREFLSDFDVVEKLLPSIRDSGK